MKNISLYNFNTYSLEKEYSRNEVTFSKVDHKFYVSPYGKKLFFPLQFIHQSFQIISVRKNKVSVCVKFYPRGKAAFSSCHGLGPIKWAAFTGNSFQMVGRPLSTGFVTQCDKFGRGNDHRLRVCSGIPHTRLAALPRPVCGLCCLWGLH